MMDERQFRRPEALVSGDWLEEHLDDPNLRIFDCTTHLVFDEGSGKPYRVVSGRSDHESDHIPGSGYLDLQGDFSRRDSPYSFTLPSAEQAAEAFGRHGIGDETQVVLYSRTTMPWATRFWWMLRWLGFDNAAILDGGYAKWVADGRPVSSQPTAYLPQNFTVNERSGLFVGRDDVLSAIDDSSTCTICALGPDVFSGENSRYGRPGRVPGSVNVPAAHLVDPETIEVAAPDRVAAAFSAVGADPDDRIITYCGGGIFATLNAYLLHQLGFEDVAVYDNSMSEWATDASLPIESD